MRPRSILGLLLAVGTALPAVAQTDMRECELTITDKIALPDGGGLFYRRVGLVPEYASVSGGPEWREVGLYGDGQVTRPDAHEAAGIAIAESIEPIDGRIGVLSVGMSNTFQEFGRFLARATSDPAKRSEVTIVNGAIGGQPADAWDEPDDTAWDIVDDRLATAGLTPEQVRVVWVKHAVRSPMFPPLDFPEHPETLQGMFEGIAKSIKTRYPNVVLTYFSSRTRAYNTNQAAQSPEPASYEGGFAVQWMIERQLNGDPDMQYTGADPEVSWLSWGPYLWTDGLGAPDGDPPSPVDARSDGMVWTCADVDRDGVHPSPPTPDAGDPTGEFKIGAQLSAFFLTDPTVTPWYLATEVGGPVVTTLTANGQDMSAGGTIAGESPFTIEFDITASGMTGVSWTYDDGTFSYLPTGSSSGPEFDDNPSPTKVFRVPGRYEVSVNARDAAGRSTLRRFDVLVDDDIVSAPESATRPRMAIVGNPLRSSTEIRFDLVDPSDVHVRVFDPAGRIVLAHDAGTRPIGAHRLTWAAVSGGARLSPGTYFVSVDAGGQRRTRRVVVTE